MKYLTPLIVISLMVATGYVTSLLLPSSNDDCCQYASLLAPDGVSEIPGQGHVEFDGPEADGGIPASLPGLKLNDPAGEVALPDIDGATRTVDFKAKKLTVFVWVSAFCPTSKIYERRLNHLQDDFAADVQFFGVNSNAMEGVDDLLDHYRDGDPDRLRMTVLKDDRNVLADRFGARVSAEAFVFNREGRLQYRGGIDDSRNENHVTVRYLRTVLKQLAAGQAPEWRYQPAKGCCPIDRVDPEEGQS